MPELDFKITQAERAARGLTPLLTFRVEITSQPESEAVQNIMLQAQIRIQAPQRTYNAREQEKLRELFGLPAQWGQMLRERFWTAANTIVGAFTGKTEARLSVPCTYDLNIASAKYFYALEAGDVPLLFLFSGTIFYAAPDGRLQVQQISWNKEAAYRMPVRVWQEMMDEHYPNSAWLYLDRRVFESLYAYRRSHGLVSWEQALEKLLVPAEEREGVIA
jgi:Family of unknown function (DUF6084)